MRRSAPEHINGSTTIVGNPPESSLRGEEILEAVQVTSLGGPRIFASILLCWTWL